jgi:hypothetical protein
VGATPRATRRDRELAALFEISCAQAHRIVIDIVTRIAAIARTGVDFDRRWS